MERLDNPFWFALTGPQQRWSMGTGQARRYAPDVAPFAALSGPSHEAWADLAATLGPGGIGVLFGSEMAVPVTNWTILRHFQMVQMLYPGAAAPLAPQARTTQLSPTDLPAMQALIKVTTPGPFAPRVTELGRYVGVWESGTAQDRRLIALSGERAQLPGFCEVSAVCVHPDAQRRGLAAAVLSAVIGGILERGEMPFLHVLEDNAVARSVYHRIGFVDRAVLQAAVVKAAGQD